MSPAHPTVDAITVEVINQGLVGIVQEMQNSVYCTGYSTILRESRDASCAILDRTGRVLSQFTVVPLHLGAFSACVEGVLRYFSPDELHDGDAILVNHPYEGGNPHAPDVAVVSPIMVDGEVFGFSASIAHKSDIGGLVPGSSSGRAREIFHEGLMIPPVRFYAAGRPVRDIETIVRANSRTPELILGDLQGQVGANALGVARVQALCAKHGAATVADAASEMIRMTEASVRDAIEAWPDGEYRGSASMHSDGLEDGKPVTVRVAVRIDGRTATFDFSDSDDQVSGPYNVRPPLLRAVCTYALKAVIDPELPVNQGLALAVDLVVRPGSVLCPEMPAPVNTYMPMANVAAEAIFDALGPALPRARIAESSPGYSGSLSHLRPGRRYPHVQYELSAGSIGARADRDGVSACKSHVANGTIMSVEIIESEFPVELTRFELIRDSGGPGLFRGGLAYAREYRMLGEGLFSTRIGHLLTPPRGREDGRPGTVGATLVNPGTPQERSVVAADGVIRLSEGDVLRREMQGSGGYGDPLARDVDRVLDDVANGYVSADAAREAYGVVVTFDGLLWDVDRAATTALRASRAH